MFLTLPKPPSVNALYKVTAQGGRPRVYFSKKGRVWFDLAMNTLLDQINPGSFCPFSEKLSVSIHLYTKRDMDVDNISKGLLDLLSNTCYLCKQKYSKRKPCKCGENKSLIMDDAQVYSLILEKTRVTKVEIEKVTVSINKYLP